MAAAARTLWSTSSSYDSYPSRTSSYTRAQALRPSTNLHPTGMPNPAAQPRPLRATSPTRYTSMLRDGSTSGIFGASSGGWVSAGTGGGASPTGRTPSPARTTSLLSDGAAAPVTRPPTGRSGGLTVEDVRTLVRWELKLHKEDLLESFSSMLANQLAVGHADTVVLMHSPLKSIDVVLLIWKATDGAGMSQLAGGGAEARTSAGSAPPPSPKLAGSTSASASNTAATKSKTKSALLSGLRSGMLEKAVEKMEVDVAAEEAAAAAGVAVAAPAPAEGKGVAVRTKGTKGKAAPAAAAESAKGKGKDAAKGIFHGRTLANQRHFPANQRHFTANQR